MKKKVEEEEKSLRICRPLRSDKKKKGKRS